MCCCNAPFVCFYFILILKKFLSIALTLSIKSSECMAHNFQNYITNVSCLHKQWRIFIRKLTREIRFDGIHTFLLIYVHVNYDAFFNATNHKLLKPILVGFCSNIPQFVGAFDDLVLIIWLNPNLILWLFTSHLVTWAIQFKHKKVTCAPTNALEIVYCS